MKSDKLVDAIGMICRRLSINKWRSLSADKRGGGQATLSFEELEALAARAYDIQNVANMIEAELAQQEGTIKKIQDDVAVVKAASAELNAHLADIQNDLANVQNQVYNNTNRISK